MSLSLPAFESLSSVDCLVGLGVTAAAAAVLYKNRQAALASKNGIPLPPGPPARWFWDNAMPATNIARTLSEWVDEYGPVISLHQGSQVIIVIGRMDAATEIMEKEGNALVDRPRSVSAGEILSGGMRIVLEGSGERFRRLRKAVHTHLQPKAAESYQDMQLEHAKDVITDILNDPKNHRAHIQRFAASFILRVTYGKSSPTSNDDPEVVRVHQAVDNFQSAMRPGAYLVDRIPWLKYVPGYGSRLKEYHKFELDLFREQFGPVESEMRRNEGGNSFSRTLLEQISQHRLLTDEMAYLAGTLFGAGSDTTSVAITNMIVAAACHPEAQKRVQDELDLVVGMDRMPSWDDSDDLPQLHAFLLEVLRWRPVTPFGFAHRATQDIIWRGQCIPAGATVFGCHWAISRDPEAFPDPEKFNPQRWLDENGQIKKDMHFFTFGFGRRVCPGKHVANRSIYINLALLLWSFRILERPDAPIDTNAYTDTSTSRAAPFEVNFVPRIEESRLRQMMANSESR